MSDAKEAAGELVAKAAEAGVKFPKIWGEVEIRRQCGSTMLSMPKTEQGSFDLAAALDALIEQVTIMIRPKTEQGSFDLAAALEALIEQVTIMIRPLFTYFSSFILIVPPWFLFISMEQRSLRKSERQMIKLKKKKKKRKMMKEKRKEVMAKKRQRKRQ